MQNEEVVAPTTWQMEVMLLFRTYEMVFGFAMVAERCSQWRWSLGEYCGWRGWDMRRAARVMTLYGYQGATRGKTAREDA